ncbi:retron St85 family effector protein [Pseudorhizobium flavum]|uniref:retron St85 family effector protein n=1 Tax=Pseudorhizobium flavum TaxID=1335061 RepID=UPI00249203C2|nr:retron St85 family effector protein [Pseudorhizobium flavum]
MIDEIEIDHFLDKVDPDNIRVYQPTSVFLVCGGPRDAASATAPSLREAYLRICTNGSLKKHSALLAEDLTQLFETGSYRDFLTLESDIAQIASLVVLFSESYGSAAELGAFTITPAISDKLFAVIDDKRFSENSFIKLGPLLALQNAHGESCVCVLNRHDINVQDIRDLRNMDLSAFHQIMQQSIDDRLKSVLEHSTFDRSQRGHLIKLIVGILQWYGALTLDELEVCLLYFDLKIPREEIVNFLLCAEFVEWVVRDKRGTRTFFAAVAQKMAVQFSFVDGLKINRLRWQSEIRDIWKTKDAFRFNCITAAQAKAL